MCVPSFGQFTNISDRRAGAQQERLAGSAYDRRIRELLTAFPRMPATVIAERIECPYSIRTLSTRVSELRPVYLAPDPASRTSYLAGEIAQCDFWFPPIKLPVGFGQTRTPTQLPVLTMITGYARWASGLLLPTRRAEDLYAGWWRLLDQLGAVPRVLVWDGEAAVGRWRPRQPKLSAACQGFRGVLGTKVLIRKPGDPEAKGIIERLHDYLERSFPPGRSFTSPADFNTQLQAWPGSLTGVGSDPWVAVRWTGSPRIRRHARLAAGAAADWMGAHASAAAGPPNHPQQQKILTECNLRRDPAIRRLLLPAP
jgi:transposase